MGVLEGTSLFPFFSLTNSQTSIQIVGLEGIRCLYVHKICTSVCMHDEKKDANLYTTSSRYSISSGDRVAEKQD